MTFLGEPMGMVCLTTWLRRYRFALILRICTDGIYTLAAFLARHVTENPFAVHSTCGACRGYVLLPQNILGTFTGLYSLWVIIPSKNIRPAAVARFMSLLQSSTSPDSGIRTHDHLIPNQVRYQAALHPDKRGGIATLQCTASFFRLR